MCRVNCNWCLFVRTYFLVRSTKLSESIDDQNTRNVSSATFWFFALYGLGRGSKPNISGSRQWPTTQHITIIGIVGKVFMLAFEWYLNEPIPYAVWGAIAQRVKNDIFPGHILAHPLIYSPNLDKNNGL